jgi:glycosyltransferase involved in cell wall biosynthesis
LAAMRALPSDADIRLVLGGRAPTQAGEEALRALPDSDPVDFVGWVDRARMREIFADARAGLVLYQPTPNIMECEPNKFFEVLSAGLPLIASDLPHWRAFIDKHECGVVVAPDDAFAVARAIQAMVDDPETAERMGRRGRALVVQEYNWEMERRKLLALYERLLGSAPVRAPSQLSKA